MPTSHKDWPDGREFAFTIFDDTDRTTVQIGKPIYEMLRDLGFQTTKSVWMLEPDSRPPIPGDSCANSEYLDWVLGLQEEGFEIGLHNVSSVTSSRQRTIQGFKEFREKISAKPIVLANHAGNLESIYWGDARVSGLRRKVLTTIKPKKRHLAFRGEDEASPLFWGDVCKEHVGYIRNFVYHDLNTLKVCPEMPYHDPDKPFVNYWFASSNGTTLPVFLKEYSYRRIDQLIDEGGLSIAYLHFVSFAPGGKVDPEFRKRMEYIASKNGWFKPVSETLDFLRQGQGISARTISPSALHRLETKWLWDKIFYTREG